MGGGKLWKVQSQGKGGVGYCRRRPSCYVECLSRTCCDAVMRGVAGIFGTKSPHPPTNSSMYFFRFVGVRFWAAHFCQ